MVPIIDDDDKREAVIGIAEGCVIPAVGAIAECCLQRNRSESP